jgi:ABC-2 type transport system permease protein
MKNNRILAIMLKETNHIFRDPRTLLIIFLMPVLQLVMFGYAMNMEIKSIKLAVFDYSHSVASRDLVESFRASHTFKVSYPLVPESELNHLFYSRKYDAVLLIPPDFEQKLHRQKRADIQLIIDASDPNAATLIKAYCIGVIGRYNQLEKASPIDIRTNILYNPDMKSAFFFVPGLIAMILVMISALLTSIAITREKELGTMEQILVSPIRSHEIVIGKVLPYIALALLDALFILAVGMFLFGVPFRGSFLVFLLFTLLYILTALSLGLLISTVAKSQQVAMMMAILSTMLPTIMLSGFIFPIASMPKVLQLVTWLVPAKYFLQIIRGIMLKGNNFTQLLQPMLALVIMTVFMLSVAVKRFSLRLK